MGERGIRSRAVSERHGGARFKCEFSASAATIGEQCAADFDNHRFKEAQVSCEKGALAGDAASAYRWGRLLVDNQRPAEAIKFYERAAKGGIAEAALALGVLYAHGVGVPKNEALSLKWTTEAAKAGNVNAQFMLGTFYAAGEGVPENAQAALHWMTKAAEGGYDFAQYWLGQAYLTGLGAPKDLIQAKTWFLKSAQQGNAKSQWRLARLLAKEGSLDEAIHWYRASAELGFDRSQADLGMAYYLGRGVAVDYHEAQRWLLKAALQNNGLAKYGLGTMAYDGKGVPQDEAKAKAWFNDACQAGFKPGCEAYAHLNQTP